MHVKQALLLLVAPRCPSFSAETLRWQFSHHKFCLWNWGLGWYYCDQILLTNSCQEISPLTFVETKYIKYFIVCAVPSTCFLFLLCVLLWHYNYSFQWFCGMDHHWCAHCVFSLPDLICVTVGHLCPSHSQAVCPSTFTSPPQLFTLINMGRQMYREQRRVSAGLCPPEIDSIVLL